MPRKSKHLQLPPPQPNAIDAPAISHQALCLPIYLSSCSLHLDQPLTTLPQRPAPAPQQARWTDVATMPHAVKTLNRRQKTRSIRDPRIAEHGQSRLRWHSRPPGIRPSRLRLRQSHARLAFVQVKPCTLTHFPALFPENKLILYSATPTSRTAAPCDWAT